MTATFGLYLLITITIFYGTFTEINAGKCTPTPNKPFYFTQCDDDVNGPIKVLKVEGFQNGVPVEKNGGVSMSKPLELVLTLQNNYANVPIATHRLDFDVLQYADDDAPGTCEWYDVETRGLTEDIDACQIYKTSCKFEGKPNKMTAVFDFQEIAGRYAEVSKLAVPGDYYGMEWTDRDGDTPLFCTRIQFRLI